MKEIKYNLLDIEDNQFAVFPDNFIDGKNFVATAMINISTKNEGAELKCESRLELKQEDNIILVSEIVCKYSINKDSWEDIDDKKKMLPSGFIRHIASLAIGTQRGVILVRTKETPLHKIVLPPVNLTAVVKKDYVIEKMVMINK